MLVLKHRAQYVWDLMRLHWGALPNYETRRSCSHLGMITYYLTTDFETATGADFGTATGTVMYVLKSILLDLIFILIPLPQLFKFLRRLYIDLYYPPPPFSQLKGREERYYSPTDPDQLLVFQSHSSPWILPWYYPVTKHEYKKINNYKAKSK